MDAADQPSSQADQSDRSFEALAHNLRRARLGRGLSLRSLAELTGTSKALLSQIERMEANPTVAILGRLASTLDQTVADLLRDSLHAPTVVRAADSTARPGDTHVRTLFTSFDRRRFELSEGVVAAGTKSMRSAHGVGSVEYAFVIDGTVTVHSNGWSVDLGAGDALRFAAEFDHTYEAGERTVRILTLVGSDDL